MPVHTITAEENIRADQFGKKKNGGPHPTQGPRYTKRDGYIAFYRDGKQWEKNSDTYGRRTRNHAHRLRR